MNHQENISWQLVNFIDRYGIVPPVWFTFVNIDKLNSRSLALDALLTLLLSNHA